MGLHFGNFIKKKFQDRCFLVNIAKFLKTPISKKITLVPRAILEYLIFAFLLQMRWQRGWKKNLWTAASEYCRAKFFICLFKEGILINVSQHFQENNCAILSFLINVVASLQLKPIFIQKDVLPLVFSWQLSELSNDNFFKKHCYQKESTVNKNVYQISITNLITQLYICLCQDFCISAQFWVTTGYMLSYQSKKNTKSSN